MCLHNNKIISLINAYNCNATSYKHKTGRAEISFVVKKEYQGNGLGTKMLIEMERILLQNGNYTQMCGKHYTDNIASHKAFLKAGYKAASFVDGKIMNNMVWKLKDIK